MLNLMNYELLNVYLERIVSLLKIGLVWVVILELKELMLCTKWHQPIQIRMELSWFDIVSN